MGWGRWPPCSTPTPTPPTPCSTATSSRPGLIKVYVSLLKLKLSQTRVQIFVKEASPSDKAVEVLKFSGVGTRSGADEEKQCTA